MSHQKRVNNSHRPTKISNTIETFYQQFHQQIRLHLFLQMIKLKFSDLNPVSLISIPIFPMQSNKFRFFSIFFIQF